MDIQTIKDMDVRGKRVLVRVDFNVPIDEKNKLITDDSRIQAVLPTIQYLIENRAKIILCSHLGRPKGKVVESMRMAIVGERLSRILDKPVITTRDSIGPEVEKVIGQMSEGDVVLLENIRFYPQEENNDPEFARALASLADVYVDDAFGTAHRSHASIVGVTNYLPSAAGFLLEKEVVSLGNILENPDHPFGGLFGGAKISDKVAMLENIREKIDYLLIGGGMAATFIKAIGYETGQSLVEQDMVEVAKNIERMASESNIEIVLPVDVIVADELSAEARLITTVPIDRVEPSMQIADIGPETVRLFKSKLEKCRTIFWNGPMGIYEIPNFAEGTKELARFIAKLDVNAVIGGGSTAEVIHDMELEDKMTFVSTGGGASLRFLSGKILPGVEVLLRKNN